MLDPWFFGHVVGCATAQLKTETQDLSMVVRKIHESTQEGGDYYWTTLSAGRWYVLLQVSVSLSLAPSPSLSSLSLFHWDHSHSLSLSPLVTWWRYGVLVSVGSLCCYPHTMLLEMGLRLITVRLQVPLLSEHRCADILRGQSYKHNTCRLFIFNPCRDAELQICKPHSLDMVIVPEYALTGPCFVSRLWVSDPRPQERW